MAELAPRSKEKEKTVSADAAHQMVNSPEFKQLVGRRWAINLALLAVLFLTYYGFILLIAVNKPMMAQKIGVVTTLGIPVGVAVIVVGWVLTYAYVLWANGSWDPEVSRLAKQLDQSSGK